MVTFAASAASRSRRPHRYVLAVAALFALLVPALDAGAQGHRARLSDDLTKRLRDGDATETSVIVTATQARIDALAARHGLRIQKRLRTGAILMVPAGELDGVTRDADLNQLSGNHRLHSQMATTTAATGATQVWEGAGQLPGVTGEGVGIAIVDSGIANVPELRGRVVATVDFTDPAGRGKDFYGHGTHVAGIVAAAGTNGQQERNGMAPGAYLVNLKVLDAEGNGTSGDVIQAIDWAVDHQRQYKLRIINLSLGGEPMQSWRDDPLCQAVARAYDAGLVVVASAGNLGKLADGTPVSGGITVPGTCPHSLTIGALNTKGTIFRSDDVVASYSSKGPTRYDHLIKPDLVAPGNRIRGLLAPGATLVREHPELVIGSGKNALLELSGTSMATAVASGAVALLLDLKPKLTPLMIRTTLQYSAEHLDGSALLAAGAGSLNVVAAAQAGKLSTADVPPLLSSTSV